mgnify:CR=1 FL=1
MVLKMEILELIGRNKELFSYDLKQYEKELFQIVSTSSFLVLGGAGSIGQAVTKEIFRPVITIYVYDDAKYEETLELCDRTSPYGLTGSIFARDRYAIDKAFNTLRYSAGNFYINDKPTGAVIAQQPFGGSRASGTNDKAGGPLNLIRWTNPRCIKECLVPPTSYGYPFLGEK